MSLNLGSLGMEDASFNFGGSYIMALDCGTTSVLATIVDEYGCIVAQARRSVKTSFPRPGWVEQDPMAVLASQIAVMMEVQFKSGIHSDRIAAIGISNQRETTVVWDRISGQPIYNAIVWQCRRTAPLIDGLVEQGAEELVRSRTGLTLDPYFSASKVQWILDNVDGARESAAAGDLMFGTIDTWLIYNLTGGQVFATDYTNASRTALFNIHTLDWDDDLLALFDVPRSMMPEVRWSSGDYGRVASDIMTNMPPIMGVAGDQQASLFGHCCFRPGQTKNTYGTGCFMLMNTGRRDRRIQERSGLHDRYRRGRQDQLCARGFYLCCRFHHELAAQQHGHHLERERVRATRRFDQRQRGLLLRPRLRRPGRSLVGPACSRYRVRPDRCLESRDHCACGLRVHGLPEL